MYVKFHISGNLFTLRKENHVCGPCLWQPCSAGETPDRKFLGIKGSVTECALACKHFVPPIGNNTCKHFSYRRWVGLGLNNSGRCNWEKTIPANCPVGFIETDAYDFYVLHGNI